MVITEHKLRAETWNTEKEETEKTITEKDQTEIVDRKTKKRSNGDTEQPKKHKMAVLIPRIAIITLCKWSELTNQKTQH